MLYEMAARKPAFESLGLPQLMVCVYMCVYMCVCEMGCVLYEMAARKPTFESLGLPQLMVCMSLCVRVCVFVKLAKCCMRG